MTIERLREVTQRQEWRSLAESVVVHGHSLPSWCESFGTYWIEAGHHIREQIGNDGLLCSFLRCSLPPYEGEALTLYRGENLSRFQSGKVGLAWTPSIEKARMFGRGLNAFYTGGVLLRAEFPAQAVIAGPNAHSLYLGEVQFTVEASHAINLTVLEQYEPVQ